MTEKNQLVTTLKDQQKSLIDEKDTVIKNMLEEKERAIKKLEDEKKLLVETL